MSNVPHAWEEKPWAGFDPTTYCFLRKSSVKIDSLAEFAYEAIALTRLSYQGAEVRAFRGVGSLEHVI